MSSTVQAWLVALGIGAACPVAALAQCTAGDHATAEAAARLVADGAEVVADDRLRTAFETAPDCRELALAAWSLRGWRAARAASPFGGRPEDLMPVIEAIDRIAPLGPAVSSAGYAVALLRAAAAASQDERDEMGLWLDHARDLARRLAVGTVAPQWPLHVDEAEGDLWLDVDDFELAEAAFARAVATRDSAAAWRGLALALSGQAKTAAACDAYRRVLAAPATGGGPAPFTAEAEAALAACPR